MSSGQRYLHGIAFGVIWLGGTFLLIEQATHQGSSKAFGLSREQLLIGTAFLGGIVWAIYYALFLRHRDRGKAQNHKA